MMEKVTFNQFRHLMSAMLFLSEDMDKEQEINDLYTDYKTQQDFEDPVEWTLDAFEGYGPETHEIYIRDTFTAKTYSEVGNDSPLKI